MEDILLAVVLSVFSFLMYVVKRLFDKKDEKTEVSQVEKAINDIDIENGKNDNVLKLMLKNVKELREYYVISKQQA